MKSQSTTRIPLTDEQQRILRDLIKKIHAGLDSSELSALISDITPQFLQAERCSVFLWDKQACKLWSVVALPNNQDIRMDARLGIAGATTMKGELINVIDAQKDERFYKQIDKKTTYPTHRVLSVPMRNLVGDVVGAVQFLKKKESKRFSKMDEGLGAVLVSSLGKAMDKSGLLKKLQQLQHKDKSEKDATQEGLIGTSEPIQHLMRTIDQLSECELPILITGENGTGKERVARAFHEHSPRAQKPFIEVDCGAIPEKLVESFFLGIQRGMATDVHERVGKFELAHGGTLFLDEIGNLSLEGQATILRVLQEKKVEPIGKRSSVPIDVRVIAATNMDLEEAIVQGRFRQDLYFRLKVIHIITPPLREIEEDIPLLAKFFLDRSCSSNGSSEKRITKRALRLMCDYDWPGNVRELEHEVQRLVAMVRRDRISSKDLAPSIQGAHERRRPVLQEGEPIRKSRHSEKPQSLKDMVNQYEKQLIENALQANHFHQGNTAEALGVSRQGFIKKLKRFGIKVVY